MKRNFGRIFIIVFLGSIVSLTLLVRTKWAGRQACSLAENRLSKALGIKLNLGYCNLDPLGGKIVVRQVEAFLPGEKQPFVSANRLAVRFQSFDLFTGSLKLNRIEVLKPRVRMHVPYVASSRAVKGNWSANASEINDFLNRLSKLEINNLLVIDGKLLIESEDGWGVELERINIGAQLVRGIYSLDLSIPKGKINADNRFNLIAIPERQISTLSLSQIRFSGYYQAKNQRLKVHQAKATLGDSQLSAMGELNNIFQTKSARIRAEASVVVPLNFLTDILGEQAPKMKGKVSIAVKKVVGSIDDPQAEAEIVLSQAKIADYDVGDTNLKIKGNKKEIHIEALEAEVGNGKVKAKGVVEVGGKFPIRGQVDLDSVKFGALLERLTLPHAWVDYLASGQVKVEGSLLPFRIKGPASIKIRDFRVYDQAWDSPSRPFRIFQFNTIKVDVLADFNSERVRLYQGKLRGPGSNLQANASLYFSENQGFRVDTRIAELDLGELKHLLGIPWKGRLSGEAHIKGPYSDPKIDGNVSIDEFRFHSLSLGKTQTKIHYQTPMLTFSETSVSKERTLIDAEGSFKFGKAMPWVQARAKIRKGRLSDVLDMVKEEHSIFSLLYKKAKARVSGEAAISGPLMTAKSTITVNLNRARYLGRRLGKGKLIIRAMDGERIELEQLDLAGPLGRISLHGHLLLDRSLDFRLDASNLLLQELWNPPIRNSKINTSNKFAEGNLSIQAHFWGNPNRPQGEGVVSAKGISIGGSNLGEGKFSVSLANSTLALRGSLGKDLLLDGRLVLEADNPFALGISANTASLEKYINWIPGFHGELEGELMATGVLSHWKKMRGDIWISRLAVGNGEFLARNDAPVEVSFQENAWEVKSLALQGPNSTTLVANGIKRANGLIDASLVGSFDVRLLESFFPWLKQSGGTVSINASFSGSIQKPTVVGTAQLEDGRFLIQEIPLSARDVTGLLEFSQNRIFITQWKGIVNRGEALASGTVEMVNFSPHRIDISALLKDVHHSINQFQPVFSGTLNLQGNVPRLFLSGQLTLSRFRYSKDIDLDTVLFSERSRPLEARKYEKKDEFLQYDLKVNIPGGGIAKIDNNVSKISFRGDLNVVGSNAHPGLIGELVAEKESKVFFRGNEFQITHATMDFHEENRVAAVVDVSAAGQIRDYRLTVHAFGPVEKLQVELQSEPEIPRADIVALLTLGGISRDYGEQLAGGGAGFASEFLFSAVGFDKQLKKFVPKNKIFRDFKASVSTQYSDSGGGVEPIVRLESRLFTDAFRLRLSRPMISGKGSKAQAEYRFNERTSAQAEWDVGSSDNSSLGDFGLDLKYRWELE